MADVIEIGGILRLPEGTLNVIDGPKLLSDLADHIHETVAAFISVRILTDISVELDLQMKSIHTPLEDLSDEGSKRISTETSLSCCYKNTR